VKHFAEALKELPVQRGVGRIETDLPHEIQCEESWNRQARQVADPQSQVTAMWKRAAYKQLDV
jgi:hypothetical protein